MPSAGAPPPHRVLMPIRRMFHPGSVRVSFRTVEVVYTWSASHLDQGTHMSPPDIKINPERLLGDLERLRAFGACGKGVVRQSLTSIDIESRRWLCSRLREAGLDARIDGIGTVFGRSRNPGRALLIGSHTDTQPQGGWLDGAMGVIYGLEVARALSECAETRTLAVDVASWIDEEGAFFGCLGSHTFCGELGDDVYETANADGKTLREALREAGLEGVAIERCEPHRYAGYAEAHIEQGPWLEHQGKRIGVVTGIVGSRNFAISATGQQNHAGTTPMALRRDAGHALVELAHEVHETFPEHVGARSVWTIGWMRFHPGSESIVPGRAEMNLQFRDQDEAVLERLAAHTRALVAEANRRGRAEIDLNEPSPPSIPALMDEGLRAHIERASERHAPGSWVRMPSAAVHDAQVLARHMPAAMMFVPSIGGISHAFEEDTSAEDLVLGCQVFASAAAGMLGG